MKQLMDRAGPIPIAFQVGSSPGAGIAAPEDSMTIRSFASTMAASRFWTGVAVLFPIGVALLAVASWAEIGRLLFELADLACAACVDPSQGMGTAAAAAGAAGAAAAAAAAAAGVTRQEESGRAPTDLERNLEERRKRALTQTWGDWVRGRQPLREWELDRTSATQKMKKMKKN